MVLAFIALLLTILVVAALSDLTGSDAAGNAMSQGFAALGLFALFAIIAAKASLRAWLSFADDNNPHAAEALEGARKLSHRTSDAVAWLTNPIQTWMKRF